MSRAKALIAIYVLMVIVTYGHSYNHQSEIYYEKGVGEIRRDFAMREVGAMFSGILWPFYWSAEFFKVKP